MVTIRIPNYLVNIALSIIGLVVTLGVFELGGRIWLNYWASAKDYRSYALYKEVEPKEFLWSPHLELVGVFERYRKVAPIVPHTGRKRQGKCQTVGVIEFFSREIRKPDERLLSTLTTGQILANWQGTPVQGIVIADAPAGAHQGVLGQVSEGANRFNLYVPGTAPNYFAGLVGVGGLPLSVARLAIQYDRTAYYGLVLRHLVSDTGGGIAVVLQNLAETIVGSISTTATATAYNTSSDARLKHAITALTGALAVVRRLRPVTHLWNADGSRGYGFLAHELQREIPDAVTGEPDAVHDDGSVKPQQVDHSKLVVWLTAALQETLAQVQALTERVAAVEGARR
jgi:hypothetical protein